MEKYDKLLDAALRNIAATFRGAQLQALVRERGAALAKASERPGGADDFELITWLVIADTHDAAEDGTADNGTPSDA